MFNSYKMAMGCNPEELEKVVNDLITSGWQPQGGVFAFNTPAGLRFFQAMTK